MNDVLAENFRENIRRRRVELGLTQLDVATRLGVTKPYVTMLENREHSPTTELIERVAKALNCHPLALLQDPVQDVVASPVVAAG